jgi:hypothetical protein
MSRAAAPRLCRRSAWLLAGCALVSPTAAAATTATSSTRAGSGGATFEARVEAPDGFSDLAGARDLLVDLYVGGRRVGEARVTVSESSVRFQDPRSVAATIPNLSDPAAVEAAIGDSLPANLALVCSPMNAGQCGKLQPQAAGVIFDEERFRINLFLAPHLLSAVSAVKAGYLAPPESGLSLASSFNFSLSGAQGRRSYQLQARNIVGLGSARLRSNAVLASRQGLLVDDLVAELDRPGWRYSGGLFWAPGSDFTGRRRMLGVGVSTQIDTRSDKEQLAGTPLFLFLQQSARVDILVDGRLVGSRFYDAGNNILDTSNLPTGSYPLTLRIHEAGAAPRVEQRFFVRSPEMAPVGRPIYFAFAGMMADTREGRPISLTDAYYLRAGTARRIGRNVGLEAAVTATRGNVLGEAGGVLATRFATVRALGLFSSRGDRGAMAQVSSGDLGPLSFTFDLRRIHSADGGALLRVPSSADSFAGATPTPAQVAGGSYTQVTGTAGLQWGAASLQLLGFYRADRGGVTNYSIGPSVNWRLVGLPGMQLTLTADAQKTRATTAAFLGARLLMTRGGLSMASTAGLAARSGSRDGTRRSGSVGSVSGQWYHRADEQTEVNLLASVDRTLDSNTAQAGAALQSRFGVARADLLHRFGGDEGGTEYVVNMQSGGAVGGGALTLGGRELAERAIIASVDGEGGPFELLVDEVVHGRVSGKASLPLFLRPYRTYQVRLRSLGERASDYDSGTREITLFPGNVVQAIWHAEPVVTLFGRALDASGKAVELALVEARRGTGQTDAEGWFQVDVSGDKALKLTRGDGSSCTVELPVVDRAKDYLRVGDVTCR